MDEEIERQQFSGAELLKRGTTVLYSGQKVSSPLLAKQTKENDINSSPQATSVNSANIQINNSRYAMEGPLTTNTSTPTYPRNKRSLTYNNRIHASKLRKKKQEPSVPVESATPAPKKSVCGSSNNYHSLALESRELSDLVKIPQKSTSISISNNVERPLMKLKICPSDNSKQDSDVIPGVCVEHSTRSHVTPEKLPKVPSPWKNNILNTKRAEDDDRFTLTATSTTTGFDLNKRLSGDETNFSARTRVYHRKTNSRKQQSNLSPEKKIHKLCHDTADQREEKASKFGHQEQCCQLVNTPVVGKSLSSQRNEKKVRVSDPFTCKLFVSMSIKHLCSEDDSSDSRGPQHCDVTNKQTKGNFIKCFVINVHFCNICSDFLWDNHLID